MQNGKQAAFDLADLDVVAGSENGIEIEIINPKHKTPTGLVFRVLGGFSERFQERLTRAVRASELREKSVVARAVGKDGDDFAELLGGVTLDWGIKETNADGQPILGDDGMPSIAWGAIPLRGEMLPFSKKAAVDIYKNFPIIRKQVLDATLDAVNFIKG